MSKPHFLPEQMCCVKGQNRAKRWVTRGSGVGDRVD
ncbi:hypothetical protein QE406_001954 [Microbacterium testaceum]|nr:hypothetical protein [Microbacterium testaceum]